MAVLQIPKLQKNDTYETVIAIANEHGESSISLLYQDLKQEKVLAGYVEGVTQAIVVQSSFAF